MDEFLFLGTGAADWTLSDQSLPVRRNSAALLNRKILLDCGPHIWHFAASYDPTVLNDVTDVLITHSHKDHFCKDSLLKLADRQKIHVVCDEYIKSQIGDHPNIRFTSVHPFHTLHIGSYKVIPVSANHDVVQRGNRTACHYIIRTPRRKTIFYGLDGAWFLRPTWEEMCKHKFDLMVLDCTVGDKADWRMFEHNTIPMLRMMTAEIEAKKMLRPDGVLVASHLSKTLHGTHEETTEILKELSMVCSFDNMKIKL